MILIIGDINYSTLNIGICKISKHDLKMQVH